MHTQSEIEAQIKSPLNQTVFFNFTLNLSGMITLTAIIEKSDDGWYVGQVEEMPEFPIIRRLNWEPSLTFSMMFLPILIKPNPR